MIEITLEQAIVMAAALRNLKEKLEQEWSAELDEDEEELLKFLEEKIDNSQTDLAT